MNKALFFLALLWWPAIGLAQGPTLSADLYSSAGTFSSDSGFSLSQSFGEPMILAGSADSLRVSEGFQQAWLQSNLAGAALDSVWPGDANYDGVANNVDLLSLGLSYGSSGPARPNASLAWLGQPAPAWLNQTQGIDRKHQDCDGSTLIDAADTLAIVQNYGLQHPLRTRRSSGVPLYVVLSQVNAQVGDTVQADIFLGADTSQFDSAYGAAFSLTLDTTLVDVANLQVSYPDSWLGQPGTDVLTLTKVLPAQGRVDLALTRIDQQARSGHGLIASAAIIMIDDLAGKTDSRKLLVDVRQAVGVDVGGAFRPLSAWGDSLYMLFSTGLPQASLRQLRVYPNPASGETVLHNPAGCQGQAALYDAQGRVCRRFRLYGREQRLSLQGLSAGAYFLRVQAEGATLALPLTLR